MAAPGAVTDPDGGALDGAQPASDSAAPRDTGSAETTDAGSSADSGGAACDSSALSADEQLLVTLPADTWYTAQGTSFIGSGVCIPVQGAIGGCGDVITAWSGGAYDPVHDKMLIWGGGHDNYWGNEVYSFDPATFTWKRETTPTPVTLSDLCQDPLYDGNPISRHTYDQLAYITHANRFWSRGVAWAGAGGCGYATLTWTLDLDTKTWTNMVPTGSPYDTGFGTFCGASGYDPSTKKIFLQTVEGLQSYDYDTNTWTQLDKFSAPPLWPRYETYGDKRGAIDTKRSLFFSFGGGNYLVFDLAANSIVTDDWITTGGGAFDNTSAVSGYPQEIITTGGGDVIDADGPGVDYDPRGDALVAWLGAAPYVLDLASKTWSTKSATGAPPPPTTQQGIYGRWRYIAKYNVFILVDGPNDDVTFYKNTAGCGP